MITRATAHNSLSTGGEGNRVHYRVSGWKHGATTSRSPFAKALQKTGAFGAARLRVTSTSGSTSRFETKGFTHPRIGSRRAGRAQTTGAGRKDRPGERQEHAVSEFDDLAKKAEGYAEQHPDQTDKAINEVEGMAENETGHQHDQQIEGVTDAAEQHFGLGQDQNQGQDQQGNQQ